MRSRCNGRNRGTSTAATATACANGTHAHCPNLDEGDPVFAYVLALHAFGLEENNLYPQAEDTGRRALAINPKVPWAVHAVAHVMEMQDRGFAKQMAGRMDPRQHAVRHMQRLQQLGIPDVVADVEEHRARRVAHVGGMHLAASELPQQPAVHRAKGQFALRCGDVRAAHAAQQPADLGAAEVGIDDEARAPLDLLGQALLAQLRAQRVGAPVLPDDGVVGWP